jgi:hypothetical protein
MSTPLTAISDPEETKKAGLVQILEDLGDTFRQAVLIELSCVRPATWRRRRVDRFYGVARDCFDQEIDVDVCIEFEHVCAALERIETSLRETVREAQIRTETETVTSFVDGRPRESGPEGDLASGGPQIDVDGDECPGEVESRSLIADSEQMLRRVEDAFAALDDDSAGDSPMKAIDLLIPVLRVPGPTMNLRLERDRVATQALARHETADACDGFIIAMLEEMLRTGLLADEGEAELRRERWRNLGWVLTATDTMALRSHDELSDLGGKADVPQVARTLRRWMVGNYLRLGFPAEVAERCVPAAMPTIGSLVDRAERVRESLRRQRLDGHDVPRVSDPYSECVQPLLMHRSWLKMQESHGESLDGLRELLRTKDTSEGSIDRLAVYLEEDAGCFIAACDEWLAVLEVLESMSGAAAADRLSQTSSAATTALLNQLFAFGSSWPIVVRCPMILGRQTRFTVSQSVDSPRRGRRASAGTGMVANAAARTSLLLLWPSAKLRGVAAWLIDSVTLRSSSAKRGPAYSQFFSQVYPLVLADAASHHVEVQCRRPEVGLVARSAFVRFPVLDGRRRSVRYCYGRWRLARRVAPLFKVPVSRVFGRTQDASTSLQHFYTNKSPEEVAAITHSVRCVSTEASGEISLVVRYALAPWVTAANIFVAVLMAVLSVVVVRLSLYDAQGGVTHGAFKDLMAVAVPITVGSLLLFAFEKHSDQLAAESFGVSGAIIVACGAIIAVASVLRAAALYPELLPPLPFDAVASLGEWWGGPHWLIQEGALVWSRVVTRRWFLAGLAGLVFGPHLAWIFGPRLAFESSHNGLVRSRLRRARLWSTRRKDA